MSERKIISLYDHFKNSPKKLKIVCDWDEVIQACEPYAFFKVIKETEKDWDWEFKRYFGDFWELPSIIGYSPYGSKIKDDYDPESDNPNLFLARQREIKIIAGHAAEIVLKCGEAITIPQGRLHGLISLQENSQLTRYFLGKNNIDSSVLTQKHAEILRRKFDEDENLEGCAA